MGRRGKKRQLELENEYWLLLRFGMGTVAGQALRRAARRTPGHTADAAD
jgi:hypothetical protein